MPINDFTKHTVLLFVRELKDVLTATPENPEGGDLLVQTASVRIASVLRRKSHRVGAMQ